MNILHLSTADNIGGAAMATYQIHSLLREAGYCSKIAVRKRNSYDPDVVRVRPKPWNRFNWAELSEKCRSRLAGGHNVRALRVFNLNQAPLLDWDVILEAIPKPDVLFLHWITGLITVADIRRLAKRINCPIVWLLMDMEPMTGGCHYPGDCLLFRSECHNCPQLEAQTKDWASWIWREKMSNLVDLPITFIAPTHWLAERLRASGLFRNSSLREIPLPISGKVGVVEKNVARQILGLPCDKKIILVGSHSLKDPRKGGAYLIEAARLLADRIGRANIDFAIVGEHGSTLAEEIPFQVHDMGYQGDIVLALIYQAADIFACSSIEDAGPMMVSQSMVYGTPVVAFDTGIVPELLASGKGGYMAQLGNTEDFAQGLMAMLDGGEEAGSHATEIASRHHDPRRIIEAYGDLLNKLLRTSKGDSLE